MRYRLAGWVRGAGLVAGLAAFVLLAGCGGKNGGSSGSGSSGSGTGGGSSGSTANFTLTLPQDLSPGINLGNTLEAINSSVTPPAGASQETYWGNPAANQAIFTAYKNAGFKSVRIPVAWSQYADANGNISAFWLNRVKQVVDYARNAGLYVIVNIHWDGGWMNNPTYAQQSAINAKLAKFWTQIADTFKDYDNHLLFAGTNEVGMADTYTAPTAEYCTVQNSFNQTFVNAVRATGGNNATRYLVVQGYNTNIDYAVSCNATVPTDTAGNRLAMEVHYYDPYDFTLNNDSSIWQWGATATDSAAVETWANESYVDAQFEKMKTDFVDKGVPVIVGEYGAYVKTNGDGSDKYSGQSAFVKKWAQYVTKSMYAHGLVPMWWDTGALFDRNTGAQKDAVTIGLIVDNAK